MSDRDGSATSRETILALLCEAERTVAALADALGVSTNAVRVHLGRLEAEGWVAHRTVRRGVGKPARVYRLTPGAESRLSAAYLPVLRGVLAALGTRVPEGEMEGVLREVGAALAAGGPARGGTVRARAESSVRVLAELGGAARVEEDDGRLRIVSRCCPIAAVVSDEPLACKLVESLVSTLVGAPVHERCNRSGRPHCTFEIGGEAEWRAAPGVTD